jgi:hypothetical protein
VNGLDKPDYIDLNQNFLVGNEDMLVRAAREVPKITQDGKIRLTSDPLNIENLWGGDL